MNRRVATNIDDRFPPAKSTSPASRISGTPRPNQQQQQLAPYHHPKMAANVPRRPIRANDAWPVDLRSRNSRRHRRPRATAPLPPWLSALCPRAARSRCCAKRCRPRRSAVASTQLRLRRSRCSSVRLSSQRRLRRHRSRSLSRNRCLCPHNLRHSRRGSQAMRLAPPPRRFYQSDR